MKIYDGRESFYQWDVNQKITSPKLKEGDEVHFGNSRTGEAIIVEAYKYNYAVVADVPNIILQETKKIVAYRYVIDGEGERTVCEKVFNVVARPKPADYVYTETECVKVEDFVLKALEEAKENGDFSDSNSSVPRMSALDEEHGNLAVEDYKNGKTFPDSYNRLYGELSNERGVYTRWCLTASPVAPLDPDPEDYAKGKKLDSVPMRMGDGFIRVPISEYGKDQPIVEGGAYDELQRAMSKKYIDTGIESRVKRLKNSDTLNRVYVEQSGERGVNLIPYCNGPTATSDHIPQRTKDGLMRCNTPDDGADYICANKGYVDKFASAILAGLDSIINAQNKLLGG